VLFRQAGAESLGRRAARVLVGPALRVGALPLVAPTISVPDGKVGAPSLVQRLEEELQRRRLLMAMAIGPPRPNRKPVLQLLTPDGRTVCFGKAAVDQHTARMVRNESDFLTRHRPHDIVVPEPMGLFTWKDHEVALFRPLDLGAPHSPAGRLRLTEAVVLDIAGLLSVQRGTVISSAWWRQVSRGGGVRDGHRAPAVRAAVAQLGRRLTGVEWTFGAWHGDLTPWNARWVGEHLHVWDWERAGGPVPLGFDVAHAEFQVANVVGGLDTAAASRRARAVAGDLLRQLGVPTSEHALLVDCYLLELCLRLIEGARFGAIGDLEVMVDDILGALTATDPA
jgi:hypothetical protein